MMWGLDIEPIEGEENSFRVLIYDRDQVIGYAAGEVGEDTAMLDTIGVNPPYRGGGAGSLMLEAFIRHARDLGSKNLTGEIKPEFGIKPGRTKSFYDQNGAVIAEDGQFRIDLKPLRISYE
jgi:GNAT superfamily N-acetyltransferase